MITPSYKITCTRKLQLTSDVFELAFEKPEGFIFKPGQFVLFDVPLIENPMDIQTRAYSIASAPQEKELLFIIKLIPGGRFSRFLVEKMEVGTSITMKGPFGFFTLDPNPDRSIVFACTSTGNAPFRSMLISALHTGDTRSMDFLYGVRSEADLFWLEELQSLMSKLSSARLHIALTQPSSSWKGFSGRVQHVLPTIIQDWSNRLLYVCGNPNMTKELKALALDTWKISKADLHVEGYM